MTPSARTYDGTDAGTLLSVNVSATVVVEHADRQIPTGIFKKPVAGRLAVAGVNVAGDDQADRRVHGGVHKAIYAYSTEDYAWWSGELDRLLESGSFGENLTTQNIDINAAAVGDRWTIESVVLEVSEPRVPCFKLGIAMGDPDFPDRFSAAGRPGTYLRVIEEGDLGAGDVIAVVPTGGEMLTIGDFAGIVRDHVGVDRVATTQGVSPSWRGWAERQLGRGR